MILGHDIKTQQSVQVSLDKSRVVFVTGKRGSGKSYTLGVLAEELYLQGNTADARPLILMVDPLGIFFTFCCPNPERTFDEPALPPAPGGAQGDALGFPPGAGGG